tara:strand:- start:126 stop:923 length:798 start_codon:yes stop_codon:yes gene_type:complete
MSEKKGLIGFLILFLFLNSCSTETENSTTGSINSDTSTSKATSSKPKTTSSSNTSEQTSTKLFPKVNTVDGLISDTVFTLNKIIDDEYEKWDEIHNAEEDCENSSLNSCGMEDPTTKYIFQNADRNNKIMDLFYAQAQYISVFAYFRENIKNCEEVVDWLAKQGETGLLRLGKLQMDDCSSDSEEFLNYSYEIDDMKSDNAKYIQIMYCQATSDEVKWAIHKVIGAVTAIGSAIDRESAQLIGIIPGASWSYCPTDNEYPPDDGS